MLTTLVQLDIQSSPRENEEPMAKCKTCGNELTCLHCTMKKRSKKIKLEYGLKQQREWGKLGGRPRKQRAVQGDTPTDAPSLSDSKQSSQQAVTNVTDKPL
jgi:hypothetical protein